MYILIPFSYSIEKIRYYQYSINVKIYCQNENELYLINVKIYSLYSDNTEEDKFICHPNYKLILFLLDTNVHLTKKDIIFSCRKYETWNINDYYMILKISNKSPTLSHSLPLLLFKLKHETRR